MPTGGAGDTVVFPGHLPFITKREIRHGFPQNFLRDGIELDDLLDDELVELEHTSGTSEVRTPLLLGRGWWAEQETRALRRNDLVARVLDEVPEARRVTISSPVCNGEVCFTGVPTLSDRIVDQPFSRASRGIRFFGATTTSRASPARRWSGSRSFWMWIPCMASHWRVIASARQFRLPRCASSWPATNLSASCIGGCWSESSACQCSISTARPRQGTC